jgi:predicted RNA polymerase sigma factor
MQLRPQTLAEVAARADSPIRFGRELGDWLHTVRTVGSRPALARTIKTAPPRLAGRFAEGALADATLAAYAEWLSARIRIDPLAWCFEPERIAPRAVVCGRRSSRPPASPARHVQAPQPLHCLA